MTNEELIKALRDFWLESDQEAAEFLGALRECAEDAIGNFDIDPGWAFRFAAVADALDKPGPGAASPSPQARLLEAAGRGGVTITSAARLLGVSRWQARQELGALRAAGSLRVHSQGRASRWVRPGTGNAA